MRKICCVAMALALTGALAYAADDGPLFRRNVSRTPDLETDHANLKMMRLFVPAQDTQGNPITIDYLVGDKDVSSVAFTRYDARPLVAFYHDGPVVHPPDAGGFPGHGQRDVFAAQSLDDGATWKNYNLSNSGDKSSFTLRDGTVYWGDTFLQSADVASNRVLVAWASRYCQSGSPLYSWLPEEKYVLLTAFPELDHPVDVDGVADPYQLYADDLFSVAGSQGSSDFADEEYPTVGEVPYACLWVARGTLEQAVNEETGEPLFNEQGEPIYEIVWRQAERVTSGTRDVHRIEVHGTEGAGFAVTWQEDPEGLRPGKGLGPGEGWSGAIAHQKTDIWYTYIGWDHFDDVCLDEVEDVYCTSGTYSDFVASEIFGTKPKAGVPMAMPIRLSDNNACVGIQKYNTDGELIDAYCYADFDDSGTADLCASSVFWTNPGGTSFDVCVAEDGRPLTGTTASTRARFKMHGYTNSDGVPSAWVMLAYEELKGLGNELDAEEEPIDIGKDLWYHSFDLSNPEIAQQGAMMNQPAIDRETGQFMTWTDEWGNARYETEIARRASLISQSLGKTKKSESGTSGLVLFKQGIINQGGPADVFARRFVVPDDFDSAVDNPFALEYMVCDEWDYADGSNPNYVRGLCLSTPINLSGNTIVACDDGSGGEACADAFPWDGDSETGFVKVTEWVQTVENLDDQSWENPYDLAKGHRGYIDGDFLMVMYGWSPNWKATADGQDTINLYVRRSFDGGITWTTLPASYAHIDGEIYSGDGTYHCEDYGSGGQTELELCTDYAAGEFEQARNLSRLVGSKITVLDPRFTPTSEYANLCFDDAVSDWVDCGYFGDDREQEYEVRDPSTYFVSFQTGDNTTVPESEATPLDMYYARAFNFGDDYDTVEVYLNSGDVVERFDWLEKDKDYHSAEAALKANPAGNLFYAVWSQWQEDKDEIPFDSDAMFRRILYVYELDGDGGEYDPPGGGGGGGGGGGRPH